MLGATISGLVIGTVLSLGAVLLLKGSIDKPVKSYVVDEDSSGFDSFYEERAERELMQLRAINVETTKFVEEQLNMYFLDYQGKTVTYEDFKDRIDIEVFYRSVRCRVADILNGTYDVLLRDHRLKALKDEYSLKDVLSTLTGVLPVDYRKVDGHKYITYEYAKQYSKGMLIAKAIDDEIKGLEKVEKYLKEKG